jgi:hypothetical protein
LFTALTLSLGDQLGGVLRDPLNQLLGDVEGQSGHKRPSGSVCVLVIAFLSRPRAVCVRFIPKVHHLTHIDILASLTYA